MSGSRSVTEEPVLTVNDVAQRIGRTERQILNYIRDGKLKAKKRGKQWLIDWASLGEFAERELGTLGKALKYLWMIEPNLGYKLYRVSEEKYTTYEIQFTLYGEFNMLIVIRVMENMKIWFAIPLLKIDTVNKPRNFDKLLEELLEINYSMGLIKFGVDPKDGDVRLEVEYPLLDGTITFNQFKTCMTMLIYAAREFYPQLLRFIIERGD